MNRFLFRPLLVWDKGACPLVSWARAAAVHPHRMHTNNWLLNIYTESCGRDKSRPYKRLSPQKGQGGGCLLIFAGTNSRAGLRQAQPPNSAARNGIWVGTHAVRPYISGCDSITALQQRDVRTRFIASSSRPLLVWDKGACAPCFVGASGCGASSQNTHKQLVIKYLHGIMWTR